MIVTLILFAVYFCVFAIYGDAFLKMIRAIDASEGLLVRISSRIMIGMAVCTGLSLIINLFLPLEPWPNATLVAGAMVLGISILRRRARLVITHFSLRLPWTVIELAAYAIIFLFILINAQTIPSNFDTSLYHAQTIRWAEEYRVVPGIVHLHSRLAYNSSWLALNALLSFVWVNGTSFHVLPAFFFLVILIELTGSAVKLHNSVTVSRLYSLFAVPALFYISAAEISSPGTDLPVLLISTIMVKRFIEQCELGQTSRARQVVLLVLSIWVVTIKLSGIPLVIFGLLVLLFAKEKRWVMKTATGLIALLWVPWMIRSGLMSGYPVYPLTFPDIFFFDWKAPSERLFSEQRVLRAWALVPGMNVNEALSLPFLRWLKMWFIDLTLNRRILTMAAFLSPLWLFLLRSISRVHNRSRIDQIWLAMLPVYTGLVYWFFTAPDIRFGFTYILPCALISVTAGLAFLESIIGRAKINRCLLTSGQIFACLIVLVLFLRSVNVKDITTHLLYPSDYPIMPTEPCKMGDFQVFCAQSYSQCWYKPFPCVPSPSETTYLRGVDWQSGFFFEAIQ